MRHKKLYERVARVILACAAFVAIGAFMLGCAPRVKNVTALPPGVTLTQAQQWDSAVANLDKIASTTAAVRQSLTAAHTAGVFPDADYANTLRLMAQIDNTQLAAVAVLNQTPKNFGAGTKAQVVGFTNSIAAALQQLTQAGAAGIKDANTLKTVNNLLSESTAAVNLILAL